MVINWKNKLNDVKQLMNKKTKEMCLFGGFGNPNNLPDITSTGSLTIDIILGTFGFPFGRIYEIYGQESSGKTSLAITTIKSAQEKGIICAYIDVEHSLDPLYCYQLGVNPETLIFSQPNYGEQALEIIEHLILTDKVKLIVLDSIATLAPKQEIEGTINDSSIALQARMISQGLRRLNALLSKYKCSLILINQIRERVGVYFGPSEITPGGKSVKYYSSIRIELRRGPQIKQNLEVVGQKIRCKIVKNKFAFPFKTGEIDFFYGKGFNFESELLCLGCTANVIKQEGGWFIFSDQKKIHGKISAIAYLAANKPVALELKKAILKWHLQKPIASN